MVLTGGLAQPVGALDGADKNSSANPWLTRTWQTDEGLPDNDVTGVAQTSDGHLWVATFGGLMRFDGERFEEFSTTHLPKVPNRVVLTMYLDRRGRLWLVMDRGAVIRVSETTARVFDATDGFAYSRGTAVAEDNEDGVWFVCGNEVCRIREDKVERFGAKEGLPSGGNTCLATDGQGQLWFACGSRIGILRAGRWQTLLTLDFGPVHLAAARAGGMFICTATRVVKYTAGGEPQELVKLPEQVTAQVMLEDHTGALWIGTGADGLLRLKGNELEHVVVSHPEITALTEDREGNLWVGTACGGLNLLRARNTKTSCSPAKFPGGTPPITPATLARHLKTERFTPHPPHFDRFPSSSARRLILEAAGSDLHKPKPQSATGPARNNRSLPPPAQEPPRCPRHAQTVTDRPANPVARVFQGDGERFSFFAGRRRG